MALPTIVTPIYTLEQPSTGKEISYRPFLVKEEKLLLMAAQVEDEQESAREAVKAIKQIIQNCCEGLDDIQHLHLFDLEYIFLQLRAASVGEIVEPTIICSKCEQPIKLKIDVSKIKVIKPEGHKFDIRLTETVGVKMKYPSFDVFQHRMVGKELNIEQVFDILIDCIECIYTDEEVHAVKDYKREEVVTFLESLNQEQFAKLEHFFETIPRVEHTVKYTCKNKVQTEDANEPCGHKGQITLSTINDFFVWVYIMIP